MIAGHIQLMFAAASLVVAPWRSGQLAALGIGSAARLPTLPDLPAIDETLPGFRAGLWFGLFAPAATASDTVARLNGEVQRVLGDAAFAERLLAPNLFEPMIGTPEAFAARVKRDAGRWKAVLAEQGLLIGRGSSSGP